MKMVKKLLLGLVAVASVLTLVSCDGLLNKDDDAGAITGSGNYNPDEPSEIDGFNFYMDLVKKYIASRGSGLDPILPIGRDSFELVFNYVGPFVTVNWGQT